MPICVRCGEHTDHPDKNGRCVICECELEKDRARRKLKRANRTPEQIAADKKHRHYLYLKHKEHHQAYVLANSERIKKYQKKYQAEYRAKKRAEGS